MAETFTNPQLSKAVGEVFHRASVDPGFRARALKDAAAALGEVATTQSPSDKKTAGKSAGVTSSLLPPDVELRFVDNSGPVKHVVLPDPVLEIDEISDLELEQVAGGLTIKSAGGSVAVDGWSL